MSKRVNISSESDWESKVGYSRVVKIGPFIEVSGTTAIDENGDIVGIGNPYHQTAFVIQKIAQYLDKAGAELKDVVRTRMYVTDISYWQEIGRAHFESFGKVMPASSMVEVKSLIDPDLLIEMEVSAYIEK
jgi:enamine deaminase RidA (YjgF/YER057c/UK114 family)